MSKYLVLLEGGASIEYWHDLEILVKGHSKSLKFVPFESLGTVSIRFL